MIDNQTATRNHVRLMIQRDMPEVLDIKRRCFCAPWTEREFIRQLRERCVIGMVAEQGDRIVGFMLYELHLSRLHVLNFAVHPEEQRTGIGAAMIDKLKGKLSPQRRTAITIEVRESNDPMHYFLRAQAFEATGVKRNAYDDSEEDAYVFRYEHGEGTVYAS